MSTIAAHLVINPDNTMITSWLAVTEADTGAAVSMARFPDRTVQVSGDFTTSGACVIEGSNDGTNYFTLTDPTGAALSFTAAGMKLIVENPLYIRPRATAGTAVAMNVYIVGAPR
jgi:hypothetical protein